MNKQEVIELINNKRVVYLATVNEEGYPRVRPVSVVKIKHGNVYIFTGSFKEVYKELNANPNVEFSIQGKGASIRLRGKVKFEDGEEIVKELLDENPGYLELYKGKEDMLKLFYLENPEVHIFEIKKMWDTSDYFAYNLSD